METNTFSGTKIAQADYAMEHLVGFNYVISARFALVIALLVDIDDSHITVMFAGLPAQL